MAVDSFPAFHVTGPVHHFAAVGNGAGQSTTYYLGTAESQPRVSYEFPTRKFMNDIAGTSLPMQEKDDGQIANIGVLLNRFSKTALSSIIPTGRMGRWSRGTVIYGIQTFYLWQVYENYLDPATRALYPGLEIGRFWPQVRVAALEDVPGNTDQKAMVQFQASNQWNRGAAYDTGAGVPGFRDWTLYSTSDDLVTFPAAVRIPQ